MVQDTDMAPYTAALMQWQPHLQGFHHIKVWPSSDLTSGYPSPFLIPGLLCSFTTVAFHVTDNCV